MDMALALALAKASGGGGGGGGGAGLLVHVAHEEGGAEFTCDKTWKEIKDAVDAGMVVYFDIENSYTGPVSILTLYSIGKIADDCFSVAAGTDYTFTTASEDGYPWAYWD